MKCSKCLKDTGTRAIGVCSECGLVAAPCPSCKEHEAVEIVLAEMVQSERRRGMTSKPPSVSAIIVMARNKHFNRQAQARRVKG
jgi:hypothetical protein